MRLRIDGDKLRVTPQDVEIKKPYPSEHACRIKNPANYDRFARQNGKMKHEGKVIDVIFGVKNGITELQAMRYPKNIWSAEDAQAHCASHEGTFEAAKE